jgi:predicted nucleotidyltransferase component of viral defense system
MDDLGKFIGQCEMIKSLKIRLLEERDRFKLPWEVLERDYLLSWILAGIERVDILRKALVFKGGTALKKCYFGDYRFSEDLDFTAIISISENEMESAMQEACSQAVDLLDAYAAVNITCNRYFERDPHPRGQLAFDIRAQFPWHRQPQVNVMVEITTDETLVKTPVIRPVLHNYGENFKAQLTVYALEEIIIEKLRAILQTQKTLERRGWVRSRARDYYDLWMILNTYRDQLDVDNFAELVRKKSDARGVTFIDANSFFSTNLLEMVEKTWEQWLGALISELPPYNKMINELRASVTSLF